MEEVKSICRVCMAQEKDEKLVPMFDGNNDRIANELFIICGVRCVYFVEFMRRNSC